MKRGREDSGYGAPSKRPTTTFRGSGPLGPSGLGPAASRLTTNDALSYLRDVKAKFADNKETYDTFLEIMKKFKAQRINTEGVIEQVKSLFKGHRELILGFNTFLPKGFEIQMPLEEDEQPKAAVEFDQAINYVNKIKTRFANDERVYKAFLEILNMYRKGQKTITNVYEEVAMLFRNHNDLLDEFTYFLPDSTPPQQQAAPPRKIAQRRLTRAGPSGDTDHLRTGRGGRQDLAKELQWVDKVKSRLKSHDGFQEFLKTVSLFSQEVISRGELVLMIQDILSRYPDLSGQFDSFLSRLEHAEYDPEAFRVRGSTRDGRKGQQSDKYGLRPVSELDVSGWERSTTSYVKLPNGYPKLKASHVSAVGAKVLQDDWVSVTSGSEDYSFKHMRKNQYEEALFRCEDDRFELDMAIQCGQSAIRALTCTAEEFGKLDAEGKERYRLDKTRIKSIHFRIVQKIYGALPGERGSEMVEMLKKNPAVAVEVVLVRLHQKIEEWQADKQKMSDVWQKIYDANYHKSLDHRSFYFKQTDKRNLGQKVMLQEIKEIAEKRRADDDLMALPTSNFSSRLMPELTYNCKDKVVHDDAMRIMKYSLEEMLSKDAADRALEFWSTVVEPFFGLPPRQKELSAKSNDTVEEAKFPKANLTAFRLQALSGDNGGDSAAPSVTDAGDHEDPSSVLDVIGEIASGRVAKAEGGPLQGTTSEERLGETDAHESDDPEEVPMPKVDEGDESDNEPDRPYVNCKPVTPAEHAKQLDQAGNTAAVGRVMYGNDHYYHFLRLHQYLFERLKVARKCAMQVGRPAFRTKSEQEQDEAVSHLDEQATEVHGKFMQLAFDLVDGTHDSSTYEDACRSLLGTNSYTLFTLDKLIYKVVKQLQAMLADDICIKLAELYRYERSRGGPVMDAVYYQNAHIILHDDSVFRFESRPDGTFTMQYLEADRSEVPPGLLQADFLTYLQTFTDNPAGSSADTTEGKFKQPFMKRNLVLLAGTTAEDEEVGVLENAELKNGLECKFSTSTSKVSYVLDTEDFFRRVKEGRKGFGFNSKDRKLHFQTWLSSAREKQPSAFQELGRPTSTETSVVS